MRDKQSVKLDTVAGDLPGIIFRFVLSPDGEWDFEFLDGDYTFLEQLGVKPEMIMENSSLALQLLSPEEQVRLNESLYRSAGTMTPFNWSGEFRTPAESVWLQFTATPQKLADQSICWSGLAMDVTVEKRQKQQIEQLNTQLKQQSETDFLTGLPNRRRFISLIEDELHRFERHGTSFCIAILDLDRFKRVNDRYGHDIGDRVLEKFSQLLKGSLRFEDTPARVGGEEFAILLPETSLAEGRRVCERIITAEKVLEAGELRIWFTCSIGLAEVQKGDTFGTLFKRADEKLYEAKRAGRNRLKG